MTICRLRRTVVAPVCAVFVAASSATGQYNRYGVHEVRAAPPTPACSATVVCFADSTRVYSNECCASTSSSAWLIFASAGDSLEFFSASASLHSFVTLDRPGRRSWQEHLPGLTAPFLRLRIPDTAAYVLTVDLDPLDSAIGLPYELRIHAMPPAQMTRRAPLLTIQGMPKALFDLRAFRSRSGRGLMPPARIHAGTFRVYAPSVDSITVCRVPCKKALTVRLAEADHHTLRP